MIRLTKGPEPAVLRDNSAEWLKVLQDKIDAGEVPTDAEKSRYRHRDIKAALVVETHGKCAYCESRLLHIAYGDVEHISPKSFRLVDTFRWDNLTLACDVCNTNKKNVLNVVDPYVDDPNEFFRFLGPAIYTRSDDNRGILTVKQLKLNRPDLLAHRSRRLEAIANLILLIRETTDLQVRSVLIDDLFSNEASDENEYAAFVRSFLAAVAPDLQDAIGIDA